MRVYKVLGNKVILYSLLEVSKKLDISYYVLSRWRKLEIIPKSLFIGKRIKGGLSRVKEVPLYMDEHIQLLSDWIHIVDGKKFKRFSKSEIELLHSNWETTDTLILEGLKEEKVLRDKLNKILNKNK